MFKASSQQAVIQAELRYQQAIAVQGIWLRWIGRLPTIFVYLVVLIFVANTFLSFVVGHPVPPVDRFERFTYHRDEDLLFSLTILWILILHFRLMFKTLSLSTYSLARERESNNWDMLLMTGIDSRTILRGKWWASVQHMWRNYAVLGFLQALTTVWAIGKSNFSMFYSFTLNINPDETAIRLLLLSIISIVFVIVISLLNLGLTTACGLLSAADYKNKNVALIFAIGIRLFTVLSIAVIPIGFAYVFRLNFVFGTLQGVIGLIIILALMTLADNGCLAGYFMLFSTPFYAVYSDPNYAHSFLDVSIVFLAAVISPLIYIALTLLALHFAERSAIRNNALPPIKIV
jgi:hypothetical protein